MTAAAPTDAALPQIATLWDAEAMLEVFRNELSEIDGAHPSIHACRVLRVRYRPGTRSIVLYELDTASTATSGDPLWVTAVTYADDRAANQHTRLSRRVAEASTHGLRPYVHVGSLRSLLQIYPYDRELPALPSLAAGTNDSLSLRWPTGWPRRHIVGIRLQGQQTPFRIPRLTRGQGPKMCHSPTLLQTHRRAVRGRE